MTNKEKAEEITNNHLNDWITGFIENNNLSKNDKNQIRFKLYNTCNEMAEWKDEQIKGFFFELALLLTTPKTNLEHSMRIAFPMSGFNEIDDILDFLHGKFLEYNNSGTILNDNNK